MLRYLIVDLLLPLLLFAVLRSFLRGIFQSGGGATRPGRPVPPPSTPDVLVGGELKQDPVCGTYVSTSASVTRKVGGQVLHFCSKECRDKYRAA